MLSCQKLWLIEWLAFYNSLATSINKNEKLSRVDKFNYLLSLFGCAAFKMVGGLSLSPKNYN